MTRMTRQGMGTLGLLGGLALCACTSRTVPLPPPTIDSVSASAQGLVVVRGFAEEGASIAVLNEESQTGVIVVSREADCSSACAFRAEVAAEPGDSLRLWQFFETSNPIDVQVPR